MYDGGLALLLRLNLSWYDGIPADELYDLTRGWWVMSAAKADRVARVFAVADGVIREVYQPTKWQRAAQPGEENRIGFTGNVAEDREMYIGQSVSRLFRPGSANPVRYLPLDAVPTDLPTLAIGGDVVAPRLGVDAQGAEPGLLERILPLLDAFEHDLLWHQSRAAQELFHSNTIAWLLNSFPVATSPLLDLLGGTTYESIDAVSVWRERHQLDIVIDPAGAHPRIVVENKLYSVPYPAQLVKYNAYPLPWSKEHDDRGAKDTRYVLLSLMKPSFPLPTPWIHVDYRNLAEALDKVEADALIDTAGQFLQYRALAHRLVSLAEAVDPTQALDEPFSATAAVAQLPGGGLDGAIARMRFSGLAQVVQSHFNSPKSFEVGGARGGIITYCRQIAQTRWIGWQFQENQLRYYVTIEDDEYQGAAHRSAREVIVEADHLDFFDHDDVATALQSDLKAKIYTPGQWLGFNPGFVYRHRPVNTTVSTAKLAEALAVMTKRVDSFADRVGYGVA